MGTTKTRRADGALLEREHELTLVAGALDAARTGSGRLLGLEGPAGIGKTSLLAQALAGPGVKGCTVLSARGSDLERDLPFGVAMQLLERPLRELSPKRREALLSGPAAPARGLLEREARRGEMGPPGGDPAIELIHGLHWLVARMAEAGPLVLAVDDLHWADELSQRLLLYLVQRLDRMPVAILAAWRTGEPGGGEALLDRLHREPAATVCELEPLGEQAIGELLERALAGGRAGGGGDLAARCLEATGGNPLYVHELIRAITGGGAEGLEALELMRAPGIARAIRLRLASLPDDARTLAEAAAVLDADCDLERAGALAGLEPARAKPAAEQLEAVDLLSGADPPVFRHPVVREAIYATLPAAGLAALHAAAAGELHQSGASPERVAAHLQRCDPVGEGWALEALRQTAVAARERGAPLIAIPYLNRALEEAGGEAERADLLVEIGVSELAAGIESGIETLREGLALSASPAAQALGRLVLGWALGVRLRSVEGVEAFERGIDELAEAEPELAHTLEANLILWAQTFAQNQREAALRIAAIAADPPEPAGTAERLVLSSLALDRALVGETERAAELAESALGDGAVLAEAGASAAPYYAGSIALAIAERLPRADELLAAASDDGRERGSLAGLVGSLLWRSWVLWRRGDLAAAEACALEGLAHPAGLMEVVRPVAVAALAAVRIEQGRLEDAQSLVAAVALPPAEVGFVLLEPLREVAGRLALERDDPEAALGQLEALRSSEEQRSGAAGLFASSQPWGTRALLALGREADALELARRSQREARRLGRARPLAAALRALAAAEPAEAIEPLEQAVAALEDAEALDLERAAALVELGVALRRARRATDARGPLAAGLETASRCGAAALAERARRELVAAGARPRRDALSGPGALTERELDVCRLALAGRSNREIAAELYVSPRTVQSHLRTSYRKLGIEGREQLAEALDAA